MLINMIKQRETITKSLKGRMNIPALRLINFLERERKLTQNEGLAGIRTNAKSLKFNTEFLFLQNLLKFIHDFLGHIFACLLWRINIQNILKDWKEGALRK